MFRVIVVHKYEIISNYSLPWRNGVFLIYPNPSVSTAILFIIITISKPFMLKPRACVFIASDVIDFQTANLHSVVLSAGNSIIRLHTRTYFQMQNKLSLPSQRIHLQLSQSNLRTSIAEEIPKILSITHNLRSLRWKKLFCWRLVKLNQSLRRVCFCTRYFRSEVWGIVDHEKISTATSYTPKSFQYSSNRSQKTMQR